MDIVDCLQWVQVIVRGFISGGVVLIGLWWNEHCARAREDRNHQQLKYERKRQEQSITADRKIIKGEELIEALHCYMRSIPDANTDYQLSYETLSRITSNYFRIQTLVELYFIKDMGGSICKLLDTFEKLLVQSPIGDNFDSVSHSEIEPTKSAAMAMMHETIKLVAQFHEPTKH